MRTFLNFANFYRKFIAGYGGIATLLTDLTKKDKTFTWGTKEQTAFDTLKERLLKEPVLYTANPEVPYEVETDASDYALGGQLGQRDKEGKLHPVAFYSLKLKGPELNYAIHDKELMAIIEAFKEWKHYLMGTKHKIKVYTDHKNLTTFTTTKELNKRQIRWYEFLSEFDFEIIYRKGSENGRADALSRREDLKPTEPAPTTVMLKTNEKGHLEMGTRHLDATWVVKPDDTWLQRIRQAYKDDALIKNIDKCEELRKFRQDYVYRGQQYVPEKLRRELITEIHEHPLHGHQGNYKTLKRVYRSYDFPGARDQVNQIIKNCDVCNKAKPARHQPYGELQPLPVPEKPWDVVTMDFVVKLPKSCEPMTEVYFDSIAVIVDKLTKYAYFIPYREASTAKELAYMFFKIVASQHGLPQQIITDRDKLFTSKFWQALMEQLKIGHKLSTAYHPQTDGQTERTNQTLEQYLRCYVNYEQNDWVQWLPTAQWAYNSATIEATSKTPFEANYGYNPTMRMAPTTVNVEQSAKTAQKLHDLHGELQKELTFLNNRMKHYADKKRLKGPALKEGDKVYVARRNIKTKRPSDKLDWKKIGPFKIDKKLSDYNYRLQLPKNTRLHPVFHVSLLEPASKDIKLATNVEVEGEPEYEVEAIKAKRHGRKGDEYLVKWLGYDEAENTWEPETNLVNCQRLLDEFHRRARNRPLLKGPIRLRDTGHSSRR